MINNLIFFLKNKSPKIVIALYLYNKLVNFLFKNKIKKFKKEHKIYLLRKKITNDYFSMHAFNFFKCLSNFKKNFQYLEIGAYEGNSAIFVAKNFKNSNIYCVDTWRGSDEHSTQNFKEVENNFLHNIKEFNNISKIKSDSDDFFYKNSNRFDCIYIDGNHDSNQVFLDCQNAWVILNINGYLICDDYSWNYYKNIKQNPCFEINKFLKSINNFEYYMVSNSQIIIKKICQKLIL
jgi:predicted O-methyltransferase YrrM